MNYYDRLYILLYPRGSYVHIRWFATVSVSESLVHMHAMSTEKGFLPCLKVRHSKILCWLYWPSFKLKNMIRTVHTIDLDEFNSPTRN